MHCHFYYQNVFIGPNFYYVPCRKPFIRAKRTLIFKAVDVDPKRKYVLRWKNIATCANTITLEQGLEGEKEECQLSSKSKTCYRPGIVTCHLNRKRARYIVDSIVFLVPLLQPQEIVAVDNFFYRIFDISDILNGSLLFSFISLYSCLTLKRKNILN
jgi:hypothetical protein